MKRPDPKQRRTRDSSVGEGGGADCPQVGEDYEALGAMSRPTASAGDLTQRQWEVLALIARGASNKEIASQLGFAVKTAEYHVAHLLRKLRAPNRAALAAYFVVESGTWKIGPILSRGQEDDLPGVVNGDCKK